MRSRRLPLLVVAAVAVVLGALLATVAASSEGGLWKLVLVAIALGLPGALAASTRPGDPVGWLLLAIACVLSAMALVTRVSGSGSAGDWSSWLLERAGAIVVPLMLLVLVLLPDGRLPSARWRPVVAAVVAAQVAVVVLWSLVEGTAGRPNPIGVLPSSWAGPVENAGDWLLQAPFLLALAAIAVRLRRREDRAGLLGVLGGAAGFAVLSVAGHVLWPSGADASDVLGAMALGAGLTVTLTRAPQLTLVGVVEVPPEADDPDLSVLSGREQEVLALLAQGLTNRQIADRLFISPVTARNHVSRILGKLGLENRTQAAALVARSRRR